MRHSADNKVSFFALHPIKATEQQMGQIVEL